MRNMLVGASLAFLAGTISIWIICHFRHITLWLPAQAGSRRWGMSCYRGSISLMTIDNSPGAHGFLFASLQEPEGVARVLDNDLQRASVMGFGMTRMSIEYGGQPGIRHIRRELLLPTWFLFAMTILPLLAARRLTRMMQREAAGCCPRCGYDLRATPERCPECGGDVKAKTW